MMVVRKLLGVLSVGAAGCCLFGRRTRVCRPLNTAIDQIRGDVKAVKERDPAAQFSLEVVTS
jgi:hypothetical protein